MFARVDRTRLLASHAAAPSVGSAGLKYQSAKESGGVVCAFLLSVRQVGEWAHTCESVAKQMLAQRCVNAEAAHSTCCRNPESRVRPDERVSETLVQRLVATIRHAAQGAAKPWQVTETASSLAPLGANARRSSATSAGVQVRRLERAQEGALV
jgi:hypothetical protein